MWIARDRNNLLWLHLEKPILNEIYGYWHSSNSLLQLEIDETLFQEITYETGPVEVELLTKSQIEEKYQEGFDKGYIKAENRYCNDKR